MPEEVNDEGEDSHSDSDSFIIHNILYFCAYLYNIKKKLSQDCRALRIKISAVKAATQGNDMPVVCYLSNRNEPTKANENIHII